MIHYDIFCQFRKTEENIFSDLYRLIIGNHIMKRIFNA